MSYNFDRVIDRKGSGCFKYDALKMLFGRDDLYSLWVADMDFAVSPQIQAALAQRTEHPVFGYNLRLDRYYEAAIYWAAHRYNWDICREWIISCPGIVPAINLAVLTFTHPGDGIIIQSPVYGPFHHAVMGHGRKLLDNRLIELDGHYRIDFDDLERKASQAKMLILCNPHNPVGRVFTEEELRAIGEICMRYNVLIFSDEIHADLVYSGYRHVPISSLDNFSEITITGFSPAKSFNVAGLSTSVIVAPEKKLFEQLNSFNEKLHLFTGNSFGIKALEAAYLESEAWLEALVKYLEENRDFVYRYFREQMPEIRINNPEGTYLAWLDFSALGMNAEALNDLLVNKAKLALDPGMKYGDYPVFQRLNFACARSILRDALDSLFNTIKQG